MPLDGGTEDAIPRSRDGYDTINSGSSYPPSLGAGAISSSQPELQDPSRMSPQSLMQQARDIRSHYEIEVRDSTLFLGYELRGVARRYAIPFANMPIGGAVQWLLYGNTGRATVTGTFVADIVRGAENLANRPLTQPEVEGYALHSSRRSLYSLGTAFSAVGIGGGLAIYSRKTMKFPFRKPQPLENYNNFPNRWMPILRGSPARLMWQLTRFNVYFFLCVALLAPLYSSMGDSAMMVGLYRDKRTHEITKGMAEAIKQNVKEKAQRRGSKEIQASRSPTSSSSESPQSEDYFYGSSESGAANEDSQGLGFDSGAEYQDGSTNTGAIREGRMQRQEPTQRSLPGSQGYGERSSDRDTANTSTSDFFFDDASPTAGNNPDMTAGGMSGGGISAWERLRRGQSSDSNKTGITPAGRHAKQGPATRQLQQRGAKDQYETSADSFSFSSSEEEKQLAKEQAQKDFDRMLDEERKGIGGGGGGDEFVSEDGRGAWGRKR